MAKNLFLWLVIVLVMVYLFGNVSGPRAGSARTVSYSEFISSVKNGQIKSVVIDDDKVIVASTRNEDKVTTYLPLEDKDLVNDLLANNVEIKGKAPQRTSLLLSIFISWFPMLLFIAIWIFFLRQMQGGGGRGAMSFGRSRARLMGQDQTKITFDDVAGCEEAKEEVKELVDYLKDPAKFQKLGGKIPRGVLLVGPPGTGKTLIARAVAGEAKVPFFTISGSDFVEMFVGVGASRVRDMFDQAKKQAPCIIFIDEIDAVGRHRGAGLGGGHDEREQTLNQLLVEMDGFEGNEGVIVMAATNRPDVLDPALLRPGRFDRQVVVGLPDIRGREQIIKVHLRRVPCAKDVKVGRIARGTPGFSGADLANLVNEAALFAARENKRKVFMQDLEKAKDKLIMGTERKSMVMDEREKRLTAYHEAGHAIVGLSMPEHDSVYKVSIIPRGRALGVTMFLPEEDRYSLSFLRLKCQLSSLFGGRIAEQLIFGDEAVTTGAANDFQKATDIARNMVTKWGLSKRLGPLTYGEDEGEVFLGHSVTKRKEISETTSTQIDEEVRILIDDAYAISENILKSNIDKLHHMADALMKYETIDSDQIADIMSGKTVREPRDWDESDDSDGEHVGLVLNDDDEASGASVEQSTTSLADSQNPSIRKPKLPFDKPADNH